MTDEQEQEQPSLKPDRDEILRLHVVDIYLQSVFDANPGVDRPVGSSRAWGVAAHLVVQGKAAAFDDWAGAAGMDQGEDRELKELLAEADRRASEPV